MQPFELLPLLSPWKQAEAIKTGMEYKAVLSREV